MTFSSANGFHLHCSEAFRRRWVIPTVGLTLLTVLLLIVYWPGFNGQWFLDDFANIHENPNVHARDLSWNQLRPAIYGRDPGQKKIDRPVAYLTLAVNHALGGTDPIGYHIVNFLIHLCTAASLYLLGRLTLGLPSMAGRYAHQAHAVALLGAVLWAVHPIQVTAVTYIVQRMAAMAALFSLLAMICFFMGRTAPKIPAKGFWFLLCAACGLLALGSKQNAVMLPVSLFLYDLFFLQEPTKRKRRTHLAWLLGTVLIIAAATALQTGLEILTAGYDHRPFTLFHRLLTQPRVLFFYLWQIIYPVSSQFTLLHDITVSNGLLTPWTTLPAAALLLALSLLSLRYLRKAPLAAFAWLLFLSNHIVESSVLPLEMIFEHRNYLPSGFLFIAAMAILLQVTASFEKNRFIFSLAIACGIVLLICFGHTTFMRNTLFADDIAFWSQNVAKAPALHRPRHNLAKAYLEKGLWEQGIEELERSLHGKVLARTNQKHISHFNLGVAYLYVGREDEAMGQFQKALELLPDHPSALNWIARIMLQRGDIEAATTYNFRALRHEPYNSDFHATRGLIVLRKNHPETAFRAGMLAFRSDPQNPMALYLLGEASRILGRLTSASRFFEQSLSYAPNQPAALLALIEILGIQGNRKEVEHLVRKLIEQSPQTPIDHLLVAYQKHYNYMGTERTERIAHSISQALTMSNP